MRRTERVKEELADVLNYALLIAVKYGFDISEIILDKMEKMPGNIPWKRPEARRKNTMNYNRVAMITRRVLYHEPQATFIEDVMMNRFVDKMTSAAARCNLHPSQAELTSWSNNAPRIKDLIQLSGIADAYVTFEHLVPYNMKRIDCMLYVRNLSGQGNVVHIELKQWSNHGVEAAESEGNFSIGQPQDTAYSVHAFTGGGQRVVAHPSQQVRG